MGGEGGSGGRDRAVHCLWGCDGEEVSEEREGGDTTSLSIPKEMSGLELRGKSSLHCDVVGCQWANGEVL